MLRNVPVYEPELGGDFNISGWISPGLYLPPLYQRPTTPDSAIGGPVGSTAGGASIVPSIVINPLTQNSLAPILLVALAALLLLKA